MAAIATKTAYGYVLSCTGGTAVTAVVLPKMNNGGTSIQVCAVHFAGANTADIITISDGDGKTFLNGYGGTGLSNHNMSFAKPVRMDGIGVSFAGATTGIAVIFCGQ